MDKAPDAFRTISEVADELEIPQHVLRFWETRFAQIKPMKRSGGRRFYRPEDVDLLRGIRRLLYTEGYTIRGVQRILKEQGVKSVQSMDANPTRAAAQTLQQAVQRPVVAIPLPERASEVHARKEAAAAARSDDDEREERRDPRVIVVTPPAPKPFTTPLPSLEILPIAAQADEPETDDEIDEPDEPEALAPSLPAASLPAAPGLSPAPSLPAPPSFSPAPSSRATNFVPARSIAPVEIERKSAVPAIGAKAPDMQKLRSALSELIACREMIDRALQEPDAPG